MVSDREMLERIAKLSSAIERQKSIVNSRGRGRGYYRGRGGGHMTLTNQRPPPPYIPPVSKTIPPSRHKQLIIHHTTPQTNNNTTINVDKKPQNNNTIVDSNRKQMTIDGTEFVVKGRKLIRKDLFDSKLSKLNLINNNLTAPKVLVRKTIKSSKLRDKNKNLVIGKAPNIKPKRIMMRTRDSKGNMVFIREPEGYVRQGRTGKSLVLNSRSVKKVRYCGFFTRYGKCPNATRCPFKHDLNRRAICPRFLQNKCKKTAATCRLSHIPNPHIIPHCVHFQKNRCSNDPCIYLHVKVNKEAPVCRAFAMEGYCPKGNTCIEKHIHVCPEFADTSKCSNANCRLPHVARRHTDAKSGIAFLGSWVSSEYFYAQKMAKMKQVQDLPVTESSSSSSLSSFVVPQPTEPVLSKDELREKEEQQGFVRLFDDSDDDDGWSQYERNGDIGQEEINSLRFNDKEEEEEEEVEEEEVEEGEVEEEEEVEEVESEELEEEEMEGLEDGELVDDDDSSGDEFYDAVDIDDRNDVEEVYQVVSDDDMDD